MAPSSRWRLDFSYGRIGSEQSIVASRLLPQLTAMFIPGRDRESNRAFPAAPGRVPDPADSR